MATPCEVACFCHVFILIFDFYWLIHFVFMKKVVCAFFLAN